MDRSEHDDKLLVRYLLGELPDDDAGDLEQAVLTDGGLFEELRAIEDDVVDAYVRDELSSGQKRRFESRFLATAEGRSRVAMARGLVAAVDRRPAPAASGETLWQRLGRFLVPPAPAARWAWAAALVLAVGLAWAGRDLLPRGPFARDPIAHDPVADAPIRTETVSFLLSRVRDSVAPPRVALASDVRIVELQVDLEGDDGRRRFRARLESSSVGELRRWPELFPQTTDWGRALTLALPAGLLSPGRYLVTVEVLGSPGSNKLVEHGRYTFEIVSVAP